MSRHEGIDVAETVAKALGPRRIDGRDAVTYLRSVNYQWRQMEWMGWYIEHIGYNALVRTLGGGRGPKFGRTEFDYQRSFVWDLKAHPTLTKDRHPSLSLILNDQEAVRNCILSHGAVGFAVVHGAVDYDLDGTFRDWHARLKGGRSDYEIEREARGAPSRIRKAGFTPVRVDIIQFKSLGDIERALREGWLGSFQEGMRNADGSPRRAKFMLRGAVPAWANVMPPLRLDR